MKSINIIFSLMLLILTSCSAPNNQVSSLQKQVDSLEKESVNTYKPGFGFFMNDIQIHHEKLYLAGEHENWTLASYELSQLKGGFKHIKNYCDENPNTKLLPIINPSIDNVEDAIKKKNLVLFDKSYAVMTTNCNNCHAAANRNYNVIKIPVSSPFSDQDFNLPAK